MLRLPLMRRQDKGDLVLGQLLIENGLTLMHVPSLLTNSEFREHCLEQVTDGNVAVLFRNSSSIISFAYCL